MSKQKSRILNEGTKKRDGLNEKPTTPKPKYTPPGQGTQKGGEKKTKK